MTDSQRHAPLAFFYEYLIMKNLTGFSLVFSDVMTIYEFSKMLIVLLLMKIANMM